MKQIEFGYSNDVDPKGSHEGMGIKPGLFLTEADYYGSVEFEGNYYIVAKVVSDEYNRFPQLLDKFIVIYNATMDKDNADKYYYFSQSFYESIHNDLYDNYEIFYAVYENKIIAMSIMIFANDRMNYHLSGSDIEYRNLAPSNLLLYKAALWGYEQGFKTLHLGGGVGSGEDNLYKFKAAFNKNANYQFSIGKQIFNLKEYNNLVERRILSDDNFDKNSNYFPLYRI